MSNTIYLLCVEKERLTGGLHYQPVVVKAEDNSVEIVCCDDLVALQHENKDIISNLIYNCEDVIIIPVSLEIYQELNFSLKESIDKAQQALNNAYDSLKKAYEIMGVEISVQDSILKSTNSLLLERASGGKCLNENLEVVESDSSYVENYYDELEEDEDYYDDFEDIK